MNFFLSLDSQKLTRLTDIENKFMVTNGESEGGVINRNLGLTDTYYYI